MGDMPTARQGNPAIPGSPITNTWWLYTLGDGPIPNSSGYAQGWGYLPANVVIQGRSNQPVPGVPVCSDYF